MALLITAGEPAGIGPDIVLGALGAMADKAAHLVIADAALLQQRAQQLGIDARFNVLELFDHSSQLAGDAINVLQVDLYAPCRAGELNAANSRYVLDTLDIAIRLCAQGAAQALVTAPVHKGIINAAGYDFSGHTEYLAAPSHSKPVMMLATKSLRVALATTHLPLRDVADAITTPLLIDVLTTLHDFLQQRCGIARPHILVCGLNPHAGEDGHLGCEEIDIIQPALAALRDKGLQLSGPLPADTLFTQHHLPTADAVLAMYHDQGLPVLKYSGFGEAVNVTLGLPFVRTSVDHGTALELAASGKAADSSLRAAMQLAARLLDGDTR